MLLLERLSSSTLTQIFLEADWVVKSVMVLLFFASFLSWYLIISRGVRVMMEVRRAKKIRKIVDHAKTLEDLQVLVGHDHAAAGRIIASVVREWYWSEQNGVRDYSTIRQRLSSVFELGVSREYRSLAGGSAWLATIGSSAPFVGLFGTVWGIMNSFIAISQSQNTSLDVVAPGMAEALLATGVGLFCAIPASIGYNRIVQGLSDVDQEWRNLVGELEVTISRLHGIARSTYS